MNVRSRAHRILNKLVRYVDVRDLESEAIKEFEISANVGELIGVYFNAPDRAERSWAITEKALILDSTNEQRVVPFSTIEAIETPALEEKHAVDKLRIRTKSGDLFVMEVRGGEGFTRDAWEVLRFFQRVLADCEQRAE